MLFTHLENLEKTEKSRINKKKQEKKTAIIKSAYALFVEKGVGKTSIDDIVKGASLAKGTFYLYFKDKDDLLDEMVYSLCFEAVGKALSEIDEENERNPQMELGESVCLFAEKLLGIFMDNRELLPIIHKNLFKGLYSQKKEEGAALSMRCEDTVIERVVNHFQTKFVNLGGTVEEARKRLYMIVEIVNAISYNAIIEEIPYTFDEIKPILMSTIRCLAYPKFN